MTIATKQQTAAIILFNQIDSELMGWEHALVQAWPVNEGVQVHHEGDREYGGTLKITPNGISPDADLRQYIEEYGWHIDLTLDNLQERILEEMAELD